MSDFPKRALAAAKKIQEEVAMLGLPEDQPEHLETAQLRDNEIYNALMEVSESLANSYAQVRADVQHPERFSWAGTAHEIREMLATLLRELAPDSAVTAQSWYGQQPNTSGPTQKQRVRYILEVNGAGSKERKVVEKVVGLEDMIGSLVRSTYNRASDAAHRFKPRQEVLRILRYFDAFAYDLLGLDQ